MKKETKTLPNGLEAEITTQDDKTTTLVEVKDKGGRVVVELREFSTFKEADKFVAELVRGGPAKDPTLKEREERFRKMGLSEAEAAVAVADNRSLPELTGEEE
jgi:hypothetical protein